MIGGVWLIFIGRFLNNAAIQSYRQVALQDALEGLPVARLMPADVPTITPLTTAQELVRAGILGSDERTLPVVEADHLVGLVCLNDMRKVAGINWDTTTVHEIMTPVNDLVVAAPDEEASQALDKLARRQVSQMPVLQAGRFVGMLRVRDIVHWLQVQGGRG